MKENDYINATDLGKLTALQSLLQTFEPSDVSNSIYREELKAVWRIVFYWKARAQKLLNKDRSEKWFFKAQVDKENAIENANLIASAHELLEACIYVLKELRNGKNHADMDKSLESAIKKATGNV